MPVCIEAFLFFGFVDMDILTLASMIIASVVGAYTMAGVVSKFNRKKVRYAMFVGMFILATVMLCKVLGVGPFGEVGLHPWRSHEHRRRSLCTLHGSLRNPRTRHRLRIPGYDGILRIPDGIR